MTLLPVFQQPAEGRELARLGVAFTVLELVKTSSN
jgi:hypothetical protein